VRLRQIRKARGLTQPDLAELAHVPQSTISQVETGVSRGRRLAVETMRRLAFVLGVSLDVLLGMPEDRPAPKRRKGI
jgi:transcriptional regulator with XRE-family HTH domain